MFNETDSKDLSQALSALSEKEGLKTSSVNYSLIPAHLQDRLLSDGDIYFCSEKEKKKISNQLYMIAVAAGSIAAALDIFWVGDIDLDTAHEWGKEKTENFVISVAKSKGYEGDSIKEAIRMLEKLYESPGDKATNEFGGGLQHHGRDFSHHFSIFGLIASLFTQFSNGKILGTDTSGDLLVVELENKDLIGDTLLDKIYNGVVVWFFHLVSDMAGSSSSKGEGTGIPGPILSMLKAFSTTPLAKSISVKYKDDSIGLSKMVSKLFNGTAFADDAHPRGIRFDLRTELGLAGYMVKKNIPNLILEVVTWSVFKVFVFQQLLASKDISEITFEDMKKFLSARTVDGFSVTWDKMLALSFGVKLGIEGTTLCAKTSQKKDTLSKVTYFLINLDFYAIGRFALCFKRSLDQINKSKQEAVFVPVVENPGWVYSYLSDGQRLLFHELLFCKVKYDIDATKKNRIKKRKQEWFLLWQTKLNEFYASELQFRDEKLIYENLNQELINSKDHYWFYMIVIALLSFEPYFKLEASSKNTKLTLNYLLSYEKNVFCENLSGIVYDTISEWFDVYQGVLYYLSGRKESDELIEKRIKKANQVIKIAAVISSIFTDVPYVESAFLTGDESFEGFTPAKMSDNIFEKSSRESALLYVFAKCVLIERYSDYNAYYDLKRKLSEDVSLFTQAYSSKQEYMTKEDEKTYKKLLRPIVACEQLISTLDPNNTRIND